MKVRAFRIPDQIVLPGLVVRVCVVPNEVLDGDAGGWEYDEEGRAVITINRKFPLAVQRYILYHELQHVMVDLLDQAIERYPKAFQTKHMWRQLRFRRNRRKTR